jgi:hypothetical protein
MIPINQPTRKGNYVQLEECKPGKHDKRKKTEKNQHWSPPYCKKRTDWQHRKNNQLRATEIHTLSGTPISY